MIRLIAVHRMGDPLWADLDERDFTGVTDERVEHDVANAVDDLIKQTRADVAVIAIDEASMRVLASATCTYEESNEVTFAGDALDIFKQDLIAIIFEHKLEHERRMYQTARDAVRTLSSDDLRAILRVKRYDVSTVMTHEAMIDLVLKPVA
jgi:RNase P/RNase MRP subunit p30